MSDSISFAVIGFGKMGILHSALVNSHPDAEVVALVDNDQRILKIFTDMNGMIKTFSSIEALKQNVPFDCVVITTPSNTHIPLLSKFSDSSPYTLVEKPLAVNNEQIEAEHLPESLKQRAFTGYVMRFLPVFNKVYHMLQKKTLGEIKSFQSQYFIESRKNKIKGWRGDPEVAGGGALITNASHLVDMCLWYFGKPEKVGGLKQHFLHQHVEDTFFGQMVYSGGIIGTIETDWSRNGYRLPFMSINIIGEKGELVVDNDGIRFSQFESVMDYDKGFHEISATELYEGVFFDIGGIEYSRQIEAFIRSFRGDQTELCSFNEAQNVQKIIDAFYLSSDSNGVLVTVD